MSDDPENTAQERGGNGGVVPPKEHRFKPGNPGRPKGSRNKLGEAFIADLYADWREHGADTLATVRKDRPQDYVKVVASILPKELNLRVDPFEEMTDDELISTIRDLDASIAQLIGGQRSSEAPSSDGPEAKLAKEVQSVH